MLTLRSVLQRICQFFKGLAVKATKKMYRSSAVFMAGAAVITVVAFTSSGFGGGGRNALTAFAETPPSDIIQEDAEEELNTEAKVQVQLTEALRQGQLLVGNQLEEDVQQKQEIEEESKAEIERIHTQIAEEEAARQRAAEEAAQKAAEEAALIAKEEAARKELEERLAEASAKVSVDDYQVLLKIVQAEAGGCDRKGKILVANVILNRVMSGQFPDSVTSVVYEPSQFSPVIDGSINSVKISAETRDCVDRALAGEDYSDGALYFMNRGRSQSGNVRWFDSHLTYLFQYGGHEFFK